MPVASAVGAVEGDGLALAYREWPSGGDGLPLILLHGITGSSADWELTAPALDGRRVIALDARGHGESDWAADEAYGGDQHFADVARALDRLQVERCVIAGFSMGGGVAMLTAACLPERVAGVVVIDAYPHPRMSAGSGRIAHWVSSRAHETRRFDPAISRQFQRMLAEGHEGRLDLRPMWQALECPALIVRGGDSDVLPPAFAAEMLQMQPRASLVTIPGVAHPIPKARPRELAGAINRFAASLASE